MESKKKRIIRIVIFAVVLAVLLVPFPLRAKDGGTVCYAAVLYRVTDYHAMTELDGVFGFTVGYRVDILWFTVYERTEFVPDTVQ